MREGRCPKCASEQIYYSNAKGAQSGLSTDSGQPLLRIYKDNRFIPDISLLEMDYYLCRQCGYLEMYVRDISQLAKLDDCTNWQKVNKA
jgi:predicted nucleic-acid-binding Zn-ribbon protein